MRDNRPFKSMDANAAAGHVAYAYTEVAAIYPITPSSPMAEHVDEWATQDRKNIFGKPVRVVEMESEGGAAGAVHGSLSTGALTTTFTASQGLLLMIPNLYKIAGEGLPGVFHVAARTLTTHALSIFGDHQDVMACRGTGMAMLASGSPQEVMDLAPVAHLSAIQASMGFIHFFDGFRTSHEIQKLRTWTDEDLKDMVDWKAIERIHAQANLPNHPYHRGSNESPETFFQHREASNLAYNHLVEIVVENMEKVNQRIGTNYKPFNYYGAPDATDVVVAMGSVCGTLEEVVDALMAQGRKVGVLEVHLYRPFSARHLLAELPDTLKRLAVLDRTKEPGAFGEPLYLDVTAVLNEGDFHEIRVIGGRYGLSSKDTTPADMYAVFQHLARDGHNHFTVGIRDDVTHLSIEPSLFPMSGDPSQVSVKFWGIGSDGLVGASKNTAKIIGDHTDQYVQAYFQYDSKKSGGLTISHLRFGDHPIRSAYYVGDADCVVCGNPAYVGRYNMVDDVKPGGDLPPQLQLDRGGAGRAPACRHEAHPGPEGHPPLSLRRGDHRPGDRPEGAHQHHHPVGLFQAGGAPAGGRGHRVYEAGHHQRLRRQGPEDRGHERGRRHGRPGGPPGRSRFPSTGPTWRRNPGRPSASPGPTPTRWTMSRTSSCPPTAWKGTPCRCLLSCHIPPARCPRGPLPLRSGPSLWKSPSGTRRTVRSAAGARRCVPMPSSGPSSSGRRTPTAWPPCPARPTRASASSSPSRRRTAWTAAPAWRCAPPG